MDDRITFLSVLITVMVALTVQSVCKNTKVSDAEGFEQKTESIQVVY